MNLNGKSVLVTGVSGTVGDRIAARLVSHGATVRGLIRSASHVSMLESMSVEPVFGDLTDKLSLRRALSGVDFVIHAAAYLGDDVDLALAANVDGVNRLAEEAVAAGVERFVHISSLSVYGEPDDGVYDESSEIAADHPDPYVSTKAESERILLRAMMKGLQCVILRPGAVCAERNSHWGDRQVERMAAADVVSWVHPGDSVPWVHAENLAEMCVLWLTHPEAVNETFNAIDGNYPEVDFRVRIARTMNKTVLPPKRSPQRALYGHEKIRGHGYRPIRDFGSTVRALEELARSYL